MPFLDHLDELRTRIIRSVIAMVIGVSLAFWLAMRIDLLGILIAPIEPLLGGTKLKYLSPTDPFFITMKLALFGGLLFSAPIIIQQLWSFVSPALKKRERRAIVPAFYLGLLLFAAGVAFAYYVVLPMTLKFTMNFQAERLEQSITIDAYLDIVFRLLLAFGLVFEVPVVMLILAAVGIVNSKQLASKRRYAVVLSTIAAALLTPGDVIVITIGLMVPLFGLYELGIALARLVERNRARARAAEEAREAAEAAEFAAESGGA
jgi:sec-independent protein translocase protein TatC